MKKGNINVSVENIFPLIKKFLYSDHEIFLRELISNATDATLKLKHLSSVLVKKRLNTEIQLLKLKLIKKVRNFTLLTKVWECQQMKLKNI